MVWIIGVDESDGLLAVEQFCKISVQEGVRDVHLMHWSSTGHYNLQNGTDRARLDTGANVSVKSTPAY